MLNWIWLGLVVVGVLVGGLLGRSGEVAEGAFSMAKFAVVNLAIPLGAIMILWLGFMRLAEASGMIAALARVIRPLMRRLFPDVPPDHPAMGSMIMNMAANMLGLGNAATPLGLRAMGQLQELNGNRDTASNAMCTFLAINTSSVTLIPATAVGLLAAAGMPDPYAIVGTAIAATLCSTTVAIIAVKLFEKMPVFNRGEGGAAVVAEEADSTGVDSAVPVAPTPGIKKRAGIGGQLVLWGLAGVFTVIFAFEFAPDWRDRMLAQTAIPAMQAETAERRAAAVAIEESAEAAGDGESADDPVWKKLVGALSVTSIPFVFAFFTLFAAVRGVRVYEEFIGGAKEGFDVALRVMPYLVAMLVAMGIFRDSGALMLIQWAIGPALALVGFPVDLLPMAIMRPLSGGGSQGVLGEILAAPGVTDTVKYTAATMFGSTETTFYVLAVYFGSVGVRKTRHALAAGLLADAAGVIAAVVICRAYFG
ncbi:hypothetical protein BH23VER1_BH23VER1_16230 [soil metagenome]